MPGLAKNIKATVDITLIVNSLTSVTKTVTKRKTNIFVCGRSDETQAV